MLINFIFGFMELFLILNIVLLIRVQKVYEYRVHLIWNDFDTYRKLPSYDEMVLKFWIWDFDKFIKEG